MDVFTIIHLRRSKCCLDLNLSHLLWILDFWYMVCKVGSFGCLTFYISFQPQYILSHSEVIVQYFPFYLLCMYYLYFALGWFHHLIRFNSPSITMSPVLCLYEWNLGLFLVEIFIRVSIIESKCQIELNIRFNLLVMNLHYDSSFSLFLPMIPLWNLALFPLILKDLHPQ
jgi:hypothetical protein